MDLMTLQEEVKSLKQKIESLEFNGGEIEQTPYNIQILLRDDLLNSASPRYWAKVVNSTVSDVNNYTVNVWQSRTSYENGDSIWQSSKQCRVPDLEDALQTGDTFEVTTTLTGEDFIATQQMGAIG